MSSKYTTLSARKGFAVLIDPDKQDSKSLQKLVEQFHENAPDLILVGGSLLFKPINGVVEQLKQSCDIPVYLFPGDVSQITETADGVFLLSLISGRNPEFLIGQHVIAAPRLKKSGLDIIPTAYMLIENGHSTSVEYVSNTRPIPFGKTDLAVATALAGEQLGMKQVYLEAGSGAAKAVGRDMIAAIRDAVDLPIIVGGGIRSVQEAENAFNAGADLIVVGTQLEEYPEQLGDFAKLCERLNS